MKSDMEQQRKRCCRCKQEKPIGEFHKNKRSSDGLCYKCKVCVRETVRIWQANHLDRAARTEYAADYRSWHKDIAKETVRRWRASHPNSGVEIENRRRTRKAGNGGSYTADEWKGLCDRYKGRCLRCGRTDLPLTVDHVVPISKGGRNSIENIQPLCQSCNARKHTQIMDYREIEKEV